MYYWTVLQCGRGSGRRRTTPKRPQPIKQASEYIAKVASASKAVLLFACSDVELQRHGPDKQSITAPIHSYYLE